MIFDTRVRGIPAQIKILSYHRAWPGTYWEPPEPAEVEFDVLDRRGRPAPWLLRGMTAEQLLDLYEQALALAAEEDEERRLDARIAACEAEREACLMGEW